MKIKNRHGLILSVSFFICSSLVLFGLNYYLLSEFVKNTVIINQITEVKTLTQQVSKSIYALQNERIAKVTSQSTLTELRDGSDRLSLHIKELKLILNKTDFFFTFFNTILTDKANEQIIKIDKEWLHWKALFDIVLTEQINEYETGLDFSLVKVSTKNIYLLSLADDLSYEILKTIENKNSTIKTWIFIILLFMIVNFIYIIYLFKSKNNINEYTIAYKNIQLNRILLSVNDGLMLINSDGKIAAEISESAHRHLGRKIQKDSVFTKLFESCLSVSDRTKIEKFIDISFNINTKTSNLNLLNPLREVTLLINGHKKYLSFTFARIIENNEIIELLVTIIDNTALVTAKNKT